jgi:hypothetical protein
MQCVVHALYTASAKRRPVDVVTLKITAIIVLVTTQIYVILLLAQLNAA